MVERTDWRAVNEGNLARTWERRLKPKEEPKRVRRVRPWLKTVVWFSALWVGGVGAVALAEHVMVMGYKVDALSSQANALQRQNQALNSSVATMTSASAMASDATRLHVQLVNPSVVVPARVAIHKVPAHLQVVSKRGWMGDVSFWIKSLNRAMAK